jgi:hypothetical protein
VRFFVRAGFQIIVGIDEHRQHPHVIDHRRGAQAAMRFVSEREVIPHPSLTSVIRTNPDWSIYFGEIFDIFFAKV